MNNNTTATQPLRPVAENSEVLRQVIDGEITRSGQGPFEQVVYADINRPEVNLQAVKRQLERLDLAQEAENERLLLLQGN